MSENKAIEFLEANPRMIGVLFTIFLVLSQAGTVAAANHHTIRGP